MRSLALLLCLAGLASAQVTPPDLGTCVALPITSATSCVRVAVDVPARGPAVVTGVTAGAWRGLSLPGGTEGFVEAGDPPPPDALRVRLAQGFSGVAVALDDREVATLDDDPLDESRAHAAAALRGALAAARLAARTADDDRLPEVVLEAEPHVPFAHVALVTALVAEAGLFCEFATGSDDVPPDVLRALAGALRGAEPSGAALSLRADGAAPWRAVHELLEAAARLGVARFTFVVRLSGRERPLASPARAGPARIFFDAPER
jgi:hypothetical protein